MDPTTKPSNEPQRRKVRSKECRFCGARIVLLGTPRRTWVPVEYGTVDVGDRLFDPAKHAKHDCRTRRNGDLLA